MYKRIILNLLVDETHVYLSRRFKKQKFCKLSETVDFLEINEMCAYCDELSIIYVGNNKLDNMDKIMETAGLNSLFVPMAIGGGIKSKKDAKQALELGCDKIILSTSLYNKPEIIKDISNYCGRQSVTLPLQLNLDEENNMIERWEKRGTCKVEVTIAENIIKKVSGLDIGELLLIDISSDGRGGGYNKKLHEQFNCSVDIPIISAGGDGKVEQVAEAMQEGMDAVMISNLFAFIGDGIKLSRQISLENLVNVAEFR